MKGGEALVETLLAWGVDIAFSVPGESYLPVLAALQQAQNRIRLITPRHEGGVTFAAAAYGRIARRPAVCFVSRGPGATNASIGVHTAMQDSIPLVLFIGNVPTGSLGKEAFQEIDYHRMYGAIAKGVLEPQHARQVPEVTARALTLASTGRPGPVIVIMPKDISDGDTGDAPIPQPGPKPSAGCDAAAAAEIAGLLAAAKRPILLAGELVSVEAASAELVALAEACGAPVIATYRQEDTYPNDHAAYAGHIEIDRVPFQTDAFAACDLIVAVGCRLDGITTRDFSLIRPDQKLVHIFPDWDVLSRWRSTVAVAANLKPTLAAVTAAVSGTAPADRVAWRDGLHAAQLDFVKADAVAVNGPVNLAKVVEAVDALAPEESVILCDSGTFARWVHRFYRFTRPHTQAGPMSGAMGYAVPGAIGTCLAKPDAPSIAFVGDGGFLMTGQELTTAVQHGLPVKVVLCDNNAWGSILVSQQRAYGTPGEFGTRLQSPDFAAVARGYGMPAWRVEKTADFEAAFREALAHPGPTLIHLLLDSRDVSPFSGEDAKV
ncbi:acetolactate synthase-1/2/3 large subunit [Constrictibacter sp. MBR-5]|jgi:acetolactate synthase-1/2/3 large subunit|uniref:thiamine pyrophosphate-dependent enzyme n=1 Tax=Constrictibacter sp. MBR-5 TaxID=3156467 RepID=UPI0033989022